MLHGSRACSLVTSTLLAGGLGVGLFIPAATAAPPDDLRLIGVIYDFRESHADFAVVPAEGYGHYAGNVDAALGTDGKPIFVGLGSEAFADLEAEGGLDFDDEFGYETPFPDTHSGYKKRQIATKVTLTSEVTVESLTAYVGFKDKETRFALYRDAGGKPGPLLAETEKAKTAKETMDWLTLDIPDTTCPPGNYWLALCFGDEDQHYASAATGGITRVLEEYDAVGKGFMSPWTGSDSATAEQVSIYANYVTGNEPRMGEDSVLPTEIGEVDKMQIATKVVMPENGTLLSISAYVGNNDKMVRYALYSDAGGEPGALMAETFTEKTSKDSMTWHKMFIDDTPLVAGAYWLALSFEEKNQTMATRPGGGVTRYKDHEAAKEGFLGDWGSSDNATTQEISIYGTYTNSTGDSTYQGYKVTQQWTNAANEPIAPIMAGVGSDDAIPFDIDGQGVVPGETFALEARVLGAAIQTSSDGYHRPVTMLVDVGGTEFDPFGPFDDAVNGNVNDNQDVTCNSNGNNPRCAVIGTFPAGAEIFVSGRSWLRDDGHLACAKDGWDPKMEATTADNTVQIKVLRNGDPVPDIDGVYDQDSAANYIAEFVDEGTGVMNMSENQVIYLFELGTSGGSSSADFQDLVVLLTMADDTASLCGAISTGGTQLCGNTFGDDDGEAVAAGKIDASGGINSAQSFEEWYEVDLGMNVAIPHEIVLVNDGSGVYEFLTDDFHPVDDKGLGNEGDDNNYYFTYTIAADFTFEKCTDQFIEFEGDDDAWIFIDGNLVMDLGGMRPGTTQLVEIDRLGFEDATEHVLQFFFAQRQDVEAAFRLRTSIELMGPSQVAASDVYD